MAMPTPASSATWRRPSNRTLRRFYFYKGPPETDHFYTTSLTEQRTVLANGWVFERIEGYLYTTQVPGSIPLYRVNRFTLATGDRVHKYTTSFLEVTNLVAAGWQLDTTAGYLYPQATPTFAGGWILGLRCPEPGRCTGPNSYSNFRDYYSPILVSANTTKLAGKTRQRVSFRFRSPDFFGGGAGHLSFGAHGRLYVYTPFVDLLCPQGAPQTNCTWHRGAGFILYSDGCGICGNNPQMAAELFWVTGNKVSGPDFWSGPKFQNNREYMAELVVGDDGLMTVRITDPSTGLVMVEEARYTASTFPPSSPFPSELTGYWMAFATDASRDFTFYVTNLQVTWLP